MDLLDRLRRVQLEVEVTTELLDAMSRIRLKTENWVATIKDAITALTPPLQISTEPTAHDRPFKLYDIQITRKPEGLVHYGWIRFEQEPEIATGGWESGIRYETEKGTRGSFTLEVGEEVTIRRVR